MATKTLSAAAFNRAANFIREQARPLEQALFAHHFEGASAEAVLSALVAFQNPDGGFGHALEADVTTPASSALATGIGLRRLQELGCSNNQPMVQQTVAYLQASFDEKCNVWPVLPPTAQELPRAPWWHDEDGSLAGIFGGYRIIPRAQLLAGLWHYAGSVEKEWLRELTRHTIDDILVEESLGSGGGDDLRYALDLAECATLPNSERQRLQPHLRQVAPQVVNTDPAAWAGYSITPLKLAPHPDSLVADLLSDALDAHLDYLIDQQQADGSWQPTWTWGNLYPEAWPSARRAWAGLITLETLTALRAFGRLAA